MHKMSSMNRIYFLTLLAAVVVVLAVGCRRPLEESDATAPATETASTVTSPPTAVTAVPSSAAVATPGPMTVAAEPLPSSTGTAMPTAVTAVSSQSPTRRAIPRPTPSTEGAPRPTPEPEPYVYDANQNMYLLLSSFDHPREQTLKALDRARAERDTSQVQVILEALPFFARGLAVSGIDAVAVLRPGSCSIRHRCRL
jgi:hypothetical protein